MTILAITAYTGSKKLVSMTEHMLGKFWDCTTICDEKFVVVAVNNAAVHPLRGLATHHLHSQTNEGFGVAINRAIRAEMSEDMTHVLVLNNDLEFPHLNWLQELLAARKDELHVLSPCTDHTATKVAVTDGPKDLHPFYHDQVSAYCWLVPSATIRLIRKNFGFELFNPDFTNYGSDDCSAAILRKLVGKKPFKVVSRSWVHHLKGQTANELGVKAGTKDLLQRLKAYKRAHKLS